MTIDFSVIVRVYIHLQIDGFPSEYAMTTMMMMNVVLVAVCVWIDTPNDSTSQHFRVFPSATSAKLA
jgi:hypothetical protein